MDRASAGVLYGGLHIRETEMQIEIDDNVAGKIVVESLFQYLESNIQDKARLDAMSERKFYQDQDRRHAKKAIRDLTRVLNHYMTREEFMNRIPTLVPNHEEILEGRG